MELILTDKEVQQALEDYDGIKQFGMDWFKINQPEIEPPKVELADPRHLIFHDYPWYLQ